VGEGVVAEDRHRHHRDDAGGIMGISRVLQSAMHGHRWRLAVFALAASAALLLPVSLTHADQFWRPNERVDDAPGSSGVWSPSIAVDSSGNTYAMWLDNRAGNYHVYFAYRPAGGSWQANTRVDDAPGSSVNFVTQHFGIAVDASGNAYAVWPDIRNGNHRIYFAYRPAGGSWQANVRVDDAPGSTDAWNPDIGVGLAGNAYAVWADSRILSHIYFAYRPAGGSWQANIQVNPIRSGDSWGPSVAVDSSGAAYVVWNYGVFADSAIYSSYRPASGSWQPARPVNDARPGANAYEPSVAVDPSGKAHAVWADYRNGDDGDIYYSDTFTATATFYLPVAMKNYFCDPYEPNNTLSTARSIDYSYTINSEICPGDPRDLYTFVNFYGNSVVIDLTNMAANANFDLYLWDWTGTTILARSERGAGQNEQIVYTLPAFGTYYIDVYPRSGSGSYSLSWNYQW
jgi:hypothetical protein